MQTRTKLYNCLITNYQSECNVLMYELEEKMRNLFRFLILFLIISFQSVIAQTILSAGDIIIPTVNADTLKNFDFVPLVDLKAGTEIKFTDAAWDSVGDSLVNNEGTMTYTASGAVSAGTVVSCPSKDGGGGFNKSGSFNPSSSGDNILVYQGDASSPTFIYGIGWAKGDSWNYDSTTNTSDIPAGLSEISCTIVNLGTADNYQYNISNGTSGTNAEILAFLTSVSNYNPNNDSAYSALSATFSVSASGYSIKGPTSPGDLVLTEINDPPESDFSYLEIYNTSLDYMNILGCSAIQYSTLRTTDFSSSEKDLSITRRSGTNIKLDGGILIAPKNFLLLIRGDDSTVSVSNFENTLHNRTLDNNVLFAWDGSASAGVPQINGDETFEITNSSGTTIDKSAANVDSLIKVNGTNETFAADKRYERISVSSYDWVKYDGDYDKATPGSISSDNQNDSSLPVSLQDFNAIPGSGKVTLIWITESETDNLGFNLYRGVNKNGEFLMLNTELIAGHGSTSERHDYSYVDKNVVNGVSYYYKLEDVDYAGKAKLYDKIVTATPTSKESDTNINQFRLYPCYPNPFNPGTNIRIVLHKPAPVKLQVYNLNGKLISTLLNMPLSAGEYNFVWNATDFRGTDVASGIYFIRMVIKNQSAISQKVLLVR